MTVTLRVPYSTYAAGSTVSFSAVTEMALIQQGIAFAAGGTAISNTTFETYDDPATQALFAALAANMGVRDLLKSDREYFVSPTGSDTNNGFTAAAAFKTPSVAINKLASTLDLGGKTLALTHTAGTFDDRLIVPQFIGQLRNENVLIRGQGSSTIIRNTNGYLPAIEINGGARCAFADLKTTAPNNGYGINASDSASITFLGGLDFGDCTGGYQVYANNSATINFFAVGNPYKISGPAAAWLNASFNGNIYVAGTVDAGGGIYAYTFGFFAGNNGGAIQAFQDRNFFANCQNITGPRYNMQSTTTTQTFGGGASSTGVSISGTTMTVPNGVGGAGFQTNRGLITGTGVTAGTIITAQLSGTTGQIGTYQVNISQTVAATTITQNYLPGSAAGSTSGGGIFA